jgi:hypothetical protein
MKCHHCKEARRDIPLNPITLCFPDRELEASFRDYRSEVASKQLRRFLLVGFVVSLLMMRLFKHQIAAAKEAGVLVPPQLAEVTPLGSAVAIGLVAILYLATFSERWRPHLHTTTLLCVGGLVVVDHLLHMVHTPLAWALSGTIINLVII